MTICGVGLIGGSLAAIARSHGLVETIVGLGRSQANLDVALQRGLVDLATRDPAQAAAGADLVVIATPILTMPDLLAQMAPHLPARAIITDVGSVKGWVVRNLEPALGPEMALVAAHPIAGKETTGAAAADPELFVGRRVIITPSARSTPEAIELVERLWLATGARVERMTPLLHDQILARASHLPQVVSSALGKALADERVGDRFAAEFGAGGLRDTTRLAASSPEIWRDICLTNRDAILDALRLFSFALQSFQRAIKAGDPAEIEGAFRAGQGIRRHLASQSQPPGDDRPQPAQTNPSSGLAHRPRNRPVIAIDGPVGAGKSTVARELARVLGFRYLNTGAMYRALALAAHQAGISGSESDLEARLEPLLRSIRIEFSGEQVMLDGRDVSGLIGQTEIGDLASKLSTLAPVRARMRELQRAIGARGGVVMEGRDIGTAVFPDAEVKFYLDADVQVRAARRFAELRAKSANVTQEQVLGQLVERDARDSSRLLAPLRCAEDAIVVNSTHLSIEQVVEQLKSQIQTRIRDRSGA